MLTDSDSGRLERSAVHWHGEDVAVGRSVLHLPHDVRQLRSVQPPRCHSRRRIFRRSKIPCGYKLIITRMWANAQPDGRPAEHRWRPLFNAAKFG